MLITFLTVIFSAYANFYIQIRAEGQKSLLNKHLKVAAEPWSPYIIFYCNGREISMREECSDKGNMSYGGALWELLTMVERVRNVTFSIIRHPNPTWGLCYDKNNCTGMIGMVNRREVDFALGKLKKYRVFE